MQVDAGVVGRGRKDDLWHIPKTWVKGRGGERDAALKGCPSAGGLCVLSNEAFESSSVEVNIYLCMVSRITFFGSVDGLGDGLGDGCPERPVIRGGGLDVEILTEYFSCSLIDFSVFEHKFYRYGVEFSISSWVTRELARSSFWSKESSFWSSCISSNEKGTLPLAYQQTPLPIYLLFSPLFQAALSGV